MAAVTGGGPGGALRRVTGRVQHPNYVADTLECGHTVADHDNRRPARRRCLACAEPDKGANLEAVRAFLRFEGDDEERFAVKARSAGSYAGDERSEYLVIDSQPETELGWAEIYTRRGEAEQRAEDLNRQLRLGGRVIWHYSQWWPLAPDEPEPAG